VALGHSRAKLDRKYGRDSSKVLTVVIHGDASIAGQGIVYETTQMMELPGYQTGGSMHIVINNQVGFTTNYLDARSSIYCTDVAKVTQSPVFHVNGDDAEAVVHVTRMAMEFRQKFRQDVYIDILCYRRYGHNEGDEPRFTQPTLYKIIEKHANPREIYFNRLLESGAVDANLAREMEDNFRKELQDRLDEVKQKPTSIEYTFDDSQWKDLRASEPGDWDESPVTGVPKEKLLPLAARVSTLPSNYTFYEKIVKIFADRQNMVEKTDKLDWAMGELLAYATLLSEGHAVRIAGQDVQRGTFAHRHAVLRVNESEETYYPLQGLGADFDIYNSLLSEYAALGFEYGYSWAAPYSLVIWEAQFGDFVNGAQIVIDQWISSAEVKWARHSGLVMLLPHGYEGQGPEHSSARLERFLELCALNNMQVVNPTTPAQIFHLLRRQLHRNYRTPLVVMTPKALLRLPEATSSMSELTSGSFKELIDDSYADAKKVTRVLVCTGKIYYDLLKKQQTDQRKDVAIVRLEQLYPLPLKQLDKVFGKYKNAKEWMWVQEEPENMGAWTHILRKLRDKPFGVISRRENATPATGYKKQHVAQQNYIVDKAFDTDGSSRNSSEKISAMADKGK
jgi:2-oxoglutarate dehydrogenase E1 component